MPKKFEPHQRPNCSKLERWRDEITEMRALDWPYRKIIRWLKEEQEYPVGLETLRKFCIVRNIAKGATSVQPIAISTPVGRTTPRPKTKKKLFEFYDHTKPIDIHKK